VHDLVGNAVNMVLQRGRPRNERRRQERTRGGVSFLIAGAELFSEAGDIRVILRASLPSGLDQTFLEQVVGLRPRAADHPRDATRAPHNLKIILALLARFLTHEVLLLRCYELL
jgi:hypothetical protein